MSAEFLTHTEEIFKNKGFSSLHAMTLGQQLYLFGKGMIDPEDVRPGGVILPEQANRIIDLLEKDDFLSKVSLERMYALEQEIEAWDIEEQQLQNLPEGDEPTDDEMPNLSEYGGKLQVRPVNMFPTIKQRTLLNNARNKGRFLSTINGMFGRALQNDITNLGVNGVEDGPPRSKFFHIAKGWLQIAQESVNTPKVVLAPGTTQNATLLTGVVADNNALTFTSRKSGTPGNDTTVTLLNPNAPNQNLKIEVALTNMVISLATDGVGAITTTATDIKNLVESDVMPNLLFKVEHTGTSTGVGVVDAMATASLAGGNNKTGWVDALSQVYLSLDKRYRHKAQFIMSPNDAFLYDFELNRSVTGHVAVATEREHEFMRVKVLPCRYMPDGAVLCTPPKNIVYGVHTDMTRNGKFHARKRVFEMVLDMSIDFQFAVYQACVYGRTV